MSVARLVFAIHVTSSTSQANSLNSFISVHHALSPAPFPDGTLPVATIDRSPRSRYQRCSSAADPDPSFDYRKLLRSTSTLVGSLQARFQTADRTESQTFRASHPTGVLMPPRTCSQSTARSLWPHTTSDIPPFTPTMMSSKKPLAISNKSFTNSDTLKRVASSCPKPAPYLLWLTGLPSSTRPLWSVSLLQVVKMLWNWDADLLNDTRASCPRRQKA